LPRGEKGILRTSAPLSARLQPPRIGRDCFIRKLTNGFGERHGPLFMAAEPSDVDACLLRLALAGHENNRNLGKRVLAYLVVDFLVAQVGLDSQPGLRKLRRRVARILVRL